MASANFMSEEIAKLLKLNVIDDRPVQFVAYNSEQLVVDGRTKCKVYWGDKEKEIDFYVVNKKHGDVPTILSNGLLGQDGSNCTWEWKGEKTVNLVLENTRFYHSEEENVFLPCSLPSMVVRNALLSDKNREELSIENFIDKHYLNIDELVKSEVSLIPEQKLININKEDISVTAIKTILGESWVDKLMFLPDKEDIIRLEKVLTKILLMKKEMPSMNTLNI